MMCALASPWLIVSAALVGSRVRRTCTRLGPMGLLEELVDRLPTRLWKPDNLFMLPGGDWHFCVGRHQRHHHGVRTVEWRGREIGRGRRPFSGHVKEDQP